MESRLEPPPSLVGNPRRERGSHRHRIRRQAGCGIHGGVQARHRVPQGADPRQTLLTSLRRRAQSGAGAVGRIERRKVNMAWADCDQYQDPEVGTDMVKNITVRVGMWCLHLRAAEAVKLRDDLSRAITEAATAAAKAVQ